MDLGRLESIPEVLAASWCDGSAGIGISRLRTRELLRNDVALSGEFEAVLRTALDCLTTPVPPDELDLSLCHGLTGIADFRLLAADVLGRPDLRPVAEDLGRSALDQIHRAKHPWPCGVRGAGETPDLMLGAAGIGWTFLRLHDSKAVPSRLLVRPKIG